MYTNETSLELLSNLDNSSFTQQQLADLNEQALAMINQQQAYKKSHPPSAIYRVATEGSQTRRGGVVQQATSPMAFTLDNGQKVKAAQKGDRVVYPDGSTAQIVTAAGEQYSHVALVGSYLSNGDEIINTLQDRCLIIGRVGVSKAEDFLPALESLKHEA